MQALEVDPVLVSSALAISRTIVAMLGRQI
jgi:hypothetical protein